MKIIKVKKIKCKQCGHQWIPRKKIVRICPNLRCHSLFFDMPKRINNGAHKNIIETTVIES